MRLVGYLKRKEGDLRPIVYISTQRHKTHLKLDMLAKERPRQMTSAPTCILPTHVRKERVVPIRIALQTKTFVLINK